MQQDELQGLAVAARQRKAAQEVEQAAWAIASRIKDVVAQLTLVGKKELLRAVEMVTAHREERLELEGVVPTGRLMAPAGGRLSRWTTGRRTPIKAGHVWRPAG